MGEGHAVEVSVDALGGHQFVVAANLDDLAGVLSGVLADGDLVLTMGAGDIGAYAQSLPALLGDGPSLKVHS